MKTCIGNLGDCSIAKSAAAILIGVGAFVAIAQPGLGQSPEPASPPPCLSPRFLKTSPWLLALVRIQPRYGASVAVPKQQVR
nr:MAG: hypothetical protein EDM05_11180 [Leptolyngbya sp. IPPAS B-1204]